MNLPAGVQTTSGNTVTSMLGTSLKKLLSTQRRENKIHFFFL